MKRIDYRLLFVMALLLLSLSLAIFIRSVAASGFWESHSYESYDTGSVIVVVKADSAGLVNGVHLDLANAVCEQVKPLKQRCSIPVVLEVNPPLTGVK